MSLFQRVQNIVIGLCMLIGAAVLILWPEDGSRETLREYAYEDYRDRMD